MEDTSFGLKLNELGLPAWKFFETTGSTNQDALGWAGEGAPDLALVVADHQTAGRGRMQRTWITRPGVALAFSQIFIPDKNEAAHPNMFSPLAGVAVAEALENLYNLAPQIKWPNDVLLSGRKVCGVLVEAFWSGNRIQAVVMGVGINVYRGSVPDDSEVIFPATCIETEINRPADRFELLREVLRRIAFWRPLMYTPQFIQAWQRRLAFMGEMVAIHHPGAESQVGVVRGVDEKGNLRLGMEPQGEILVSYGDVQLMKVDQNQDKAGH